MSFRRITQSLVALIVITTLMISVCDSLPKYCQCIESKGNQFNAFAEYFIRDGKTTEFWLYQNRHRCRMSVMNKTDIVIDTWSEIQTLDLDYRLWHGFYYDNEVYEFSRAYPKPESESEYVMECRKGSELYYDMFAINRVNVSNGFVIITETEAKPRLPVVLLFNKLEGNWIRIEKSPKVGYIKHNVFNYYYTVFKDSLIESDQLSDLLKDIASNVYINPVLNAYDAKHDTKGFFIFVTNNGIPMYCYKSHIHDTSESCKMENMKPFMRESFTETETTMYFTTNTTTISPKTTETLTNNTNTEKTTMNTITTTEKQNSGLFNVLFIIICIIIIAIIIFLIPGIIWLFRHSIKRDKKQNTTSTSTSTLSTEESVKPVKNEK